jgi:hypothetical protein
LKRPAEFRTLFSQTHHNQAVVAKPLPPLK